MAASPGILLDTGLLVAYLADDEQHHAWATEQFRRHDGRAITCEGAISEAWFLLRHQPRHLARLRAMLADRVHDLSFHREDEAAPISRLMDRYRDVPMSLADACLVRLSRRRRSPKEGTRGAETVRRSSNPAPLRSPP